MKSTKETGVGDGHVIFAEVEETHVVTDGQAIGDEAKHGRLRVRVRFVLQQDEELAGNNETVSFSQVSLEPQQDGATGPFQWRSVRHVNVVLSDNSSSKNLILWLSLFIEQISFLIADQNSMKIAQELTYAVDDAANVRRTLPIDAVFNEFSRHDGRHVESRLNYDFPVKFPVHREREETPFPARTGQRARWRGNFQISLFFDTFGSITIGFQNFLLIFHS
jgi:hypothetical protein